MKRPVSNGGAEQDVSGETLREKEAFNFALFQHNPAPTVVVDKHGRVIKSNLAQRHSMDGLPDLSKPLFPPDAGETEARLHGELMACIDSGEVRYFPEMELGERSFNITMAPLPSGAIVVTEDITEQKLAREQLIHADKMVALGTLVSGVAHEISNPNNALILSAKCLNRLVNSVLKVMDERRDEAGDFHVGRLTYEEAREQLVDLMNTIVSVGDRIKSTVNDLKEFARRENAELKQLVDLNVAVQAAVRLLAPVIRKATSSFSVELADSLPPVLANAQRIEQVVVNLLVNACQALTAAGQSVFVTTSYDPKSKSVIVAVKDEGRGIEPKHLKRITDPFFTTRHDEGGTGLGLSVSRKIVSNYGGRLLFASEPGRGTTASVVLPSHAVTEEN